MKSFLKSFFLTLAASMALATGVQAAAIGFNPSSVGSLNPGDMFTMDVVISDLGGEIVSAYDLDIIFDEAVLDVNSVAFSSMLGDVGLFEAFVDSNVSPGVVDLASISLLSDAALLALQGGNSVVLATIAFTYDGPGRSAIDFSFDPFNDVKGAGAAVLDLDVTPGSANAIPEPSAALTFAAGMLVMASSIRLRRA